MLYFYKGACWMMTADSNEELGQMEYKLGVHKSAVKDGYCELTEHQRARTAYAGGYRVNKDTFEKAAAHLTEEVEI